MGSNEKLEFYRTYAPLAVEQMIKYGIPASVTLAQAWTERGAAQSQDNNFFGIKCGSQWIADGKPYVTLNDDAVGEKFRRYGSAGESFEDHSRLLLTVSNYSQGRSCAPDDYLGWCKAVSNGYSTTSGYGDSLRELIDGQAETRLYDLRQYDRMAMERARQMGVECGYLRSAIGVAPVRHPFSLPLEAGEGGVLVVTDPYHKEPTGYRPHVHEGLDLRANRSAVLATQDGGRIVTKGYDEVSGNKVTIEYGSGQDRVRVTYCHLDSISVNVGDQVSAGQQVAVSGNTGQSTGPHLHMQVEQLDQDGSFVKTNPMVYLSDIARKGDIGLTLTDSKDDSVLYCYNAGQAGQDVAGSDLAQKDGEVTQGDWLSRLSGSSDPKEWLQILLSRDGDAGHGGDIISELIGALLSGLIAMAQLSQARDKDGEQETSDVMASDIVTIDARRDNSSVHRPSGREAIVAKAAGIAAASFDELSPQERSQGMSLSQS